MPPYALCLQQYLVAIPRSLPLIQVLIYKEAATRSGSKTRWQPSKVEKVPNPGPENGSPGDIN